MAPEQIKEQHVTPASDQFGLAVIAYELATGRKPFDGGTFSSLLYKIMSEPAPRAGELNPRLPSAAEDVLDRALAKDPADRYESCDAFVAALEAACATLAEDGLSERVQTPQAEAPDSEETAVARLSLEQLRKVESTRATGYLSPAAPTGEESGRRKIILGAVAGVAALIALAVALTVGGGDSPPPGQEQQQQPAGPIVLAENPPAQDPTNTVATSPPPAAVPPPAQPSASPKGSGGAATQAPAASATVPAAQPAITEAPLLVGATTTIVWRGQLDPGAELRIEGDKASIGDISRGLPGEPVQIEVSPNVLEILEAPSAANGWLRLRLLNGGDRARRYFLIRCRAL
jgi:serine/threonine-protein kinase